MASTPEDAVRPSLDRAVQAMAALEQTASRHQRLVAFQNVIMIMLLVAMLALASVLVVYTRALISRY